MNPPPAPFQLTLSQRQSECWERLREYMVQRITVLHQHLEREQSESETARLRGRIAELRSLLTFDKEL